MESEEYIELARETDQALQKSFRDVTKGKIIGEEFQYDSDGLQGSSVRVESDNNAKCGQNMGVSLPNELPISDKSVECVIYVSDVSPQLNIDDNEPITSQITISLYEDTPEISPPDSEIQALDISMPSKLRSLRGRIIC